MFLALASLYLLFAGAWLPFAPDRTPNHLRNPLFDLWEILMFPGMMVIYGFYKILVHGR